MIERRIKGRVVDIWNIGQPDVVRYIMTLEEDLDKKRRVFVLVPRKNYKNVALLDAAFFYGFVVSMRVLYEERSNVMLVYKMKDVKVEDDVLDKGER